MDVSTFLKFLVIRFSPELSVNPEIVEFAELPVKVNVLLPVLNVGAEGTVGSGINRDLMRDPFYP